MMRCTVYLASGRQCARSAEPLHAGGDGARCWEHAPRRVQIAFLMQEFAALQVLILEGRHVEEGPRFAEFARRHALVRQRLLHEEGLGFDGGGRLPGGG